jgi:hypothetical protein
MTLGANDALAQTVEEVSFTFQKTEDYRLKGGGFLSV